MIQGITINEIINKYPYASEFIEQLQFDVSGKEDKTIAEIISEIDDTEIEDLAIDAENIESQLEAYIKGMQEFLGITDDAIHSLTIIAGQNKSGEDENFSELEIHPSEIISIVGPTGSGKSRLLADIEWAADGDTPTKRKIRINADKPDPKWRYSTNHKLVAQLSQNMNFVMDLSAMEFVTMHAESRFVENPEKVVKQILEEANKLAGEKFDPDTPVTALSGGQSRALMIADTAVLSSSPIILIDEIENAGIDRKKALDLLVSKDKIVLMATHDPLLALMADRRIVIKNGGINAVIETSDEEKKILSRLEEIDGVIQGARTSLRKGERLKS